MVRGGGMKREEGGRGVGGLVRVWGAYPAAAAPSRAGARVRETSPPATPPSYSPSARAQEAIANEKLLTPAFLEYQAAPRTP